ncbi:MAG: hypothetical protein IJC26_02075 [Clostridia bacterium]|nr:hypothetical protein [Clostridia bacterium]
MNYKIIRGKKSELDTAEQAYIADVPWGSEYTPTSYFQGIFVENEGFLFKLTALESDPTVTMEGFAPAVSMDSCLEIFLNFDPEHTDTYINFEMNPKGAYLFGIGPDRYGRKILEGDVMPTVQGEILEKSWSVTLFIPLASIEQVYGKLDFIPGYQIKGNAFKCGGNAPVPHHLTWAPVQRTERDFHKPACFGTLEIL